MGADVLSEGSNRETTEMRYLLGTLSQDDESRMEEAFFADDEKFEELEIAEAELIDAYLRSELSTGDRERFEAKLRASPRLLERVRFARLLKDKAADSFSPQKEASTQPSYPDRQPERKPKIKWWEGLLAQPAFRVAVAAGVFIVLACGIALLFGWRNLRNQSNRLASERAVLEQQRRERHAESTNRQTNAQQLPTNRQPERDQLAEDQKPKRETPDQPILGSVTSILLTPGSLRSGGGRQELALGSDTGTVQLKLALENNEYRSYGVTIKTAEGYVVYRQNALQSRKSGSGPMLILSIPARRLPPGDYIVDVNGRTSSGHFESVSNYAFRVVK
jgi:anti-sigma factor RsiW